MASILLSIKPEYVECILAGSKKYEFRKRLADKPVEKIIIYPTAPTMRIVGEVQVVGTISASPTTLWEQTKGSTGITRENIESISKAAKSPMSTVWAM